LLVDITHSSVQIKYYRLNRDFVFKRVNSNACIFAKTKKLYSYCFVCEKLSFQKIATSPIPFACWKLHVNKIKTRL